MNHIINVKEWYCEYIFMYDEIDKAILIKINNQTNELHNHDKNII